MRGLQALGGPCPQAAILGAQQNRGAKNCDRVRFHGRNLGVARVVGGPFQRSSSEGIDQELESTLMQKLLRKKQLKKQIKMRKRQQESSSSSSSSESESSDSEDEDCGAKAAAKASKRKNKLRALSLQGIQGIHGIQDQGMVASGGLQFEVCGGLQFEVCTGGKCRKNGSQEVLAAFKQGNASVAACKCMGQCDQGSNVRVYRGLETSPIVYNGVSPANANILIQQHRASSNNPILVF